jgi:PHD/YefM family antitoxin component YafN of YafNO toxin-antitoxin module
MKLLHEPELITRNGKPTGVILSIKEYKSLLEGTENAGDARWLWERRKRPMSFRTLDQFLAKRAARA